MNTNKMNAIGIAVVLSAAIAWLIVSIQQFISDESFHSVDGSVSESGMLLSAVAAFYFIIAALLSVRRGFLKVVVIATNVPAILISLYLMFVAMADPVAIVFFAMIFVPSVTALSVSVVSGKSR